MGVLCLVLVLLCITWCPFFFCNHLDREERAGYFTLIVFLTYLLTYLLMSYDCYCSVALPHGAVGWSAVALVFPDHTHLLFYTH